MPTKVIYTHVGENFKIENKNVCETSVKIKILRSVSQWLGGLPFSKKIFTNTSTPDKFLG
jgi:hypothetical protein